MVKSVRLSEEREFEMRRREIGADWWCREKQRCLGPIRSATAVGFVPLARRRSGWLMLEIRNRKHWALCFAGRFYRGDRPSPRGLPVELRRRSDAPDGARNKIGKIEMTPRK